MPIPPTSPPLTPKSDQVEDFHGTPVPDPYRWLEDAADPEVQTWTKAHNQRTRAYLDQFPYLEKIKARLTELWNFPKYEGIHKAGGKYFIEINDGLQNQAVLYKQDELKAKPTVLLDPNTLSEDGTVAVFQQSYSKDGNLLGYTLSSSGSDWQEIHILNTETGQKYQEVLEWCKFASIGWKIDGSGFFYNRFTKPNDLWGDDSELFSQVCWHSLGTPQSADELIYQEPENQERRFFPYITEDGRYLCLYVSRVTDRHNGCYLRPIDSDDDFLHLVEDGEATYGFAGNRGSVFYFRTDLEAPNGKVIAIDVEHPAREHWVEIIPEGTDALQSVALWGSHLITVSSHHAHNLIGVYDLEGHHLRDVPLPTLGTVGLLEGSAEDTEFFFSFESFLYPRSIFRYDIESDELSPIGETPLDFDIGNYTTEQAFYKSKDGTRVPMFLTHKKSLEKNGENPTILYGYGGFTLSQTPFFNVWNLVWLEMGGIFALANLRGGTEYGETWHEAGMLENKQNVFDDFIAGAEWLIEQGYTRTQKLAIEGRSNGGTLTSACFVQRPDLFGAVLCWVPVTDMLRFHKFTVGRYWTSEFGNAEENPEHFKFLYAYSPLHNVKAGVEYPPIIVTTGDTDDRVVPAHSKKFIAEVLEKTAGDSPHLLRIDLKAGHKLGKPTYKLIEEHTDVWAFAAHTLGMEVDL
jgi:prolyl oligopeptidase